MSRATNIINSQNEAKFANTDWIIQKGTDFTTYGVVIDARDNGKTQAVIFTAYDGKTTGKAKKQFIQNMHPAAQKIAKPEEVVPQKIMQKINDVAGVLGTHAGIKK